MDLVRLQKFFNGEIELDQAELEVYVLCLFDQLTLVNRNIVELEQALENLEFEFSELAQAFEWSR